MLINSCTKCTLGLLFKGLFLVLHPNKSRHSGNGIACLQAMPRAALGFCSATAPKIFAISSITDKNSCHNFARLSAWWFDWVGHPHPKRKHIRSVLINVLCNFEDGTRAAMAASKSSVGLDGCTRMRGVLLRSCHAGEVA